MRNFIYVFACVSLLLHSCGVNSNLMFKVPKGEMNYDSIPLQPMEDYRISVDDKITFDLTTNKGANIIDKMSGVDLESVATPSVYEYTVRRNGKVELPVIGEVAVAGLTIQECEDFLIQKFDSYQDPFVQVKVTNQRVIVFPGNGSDAKVIPLLNSNTTLMEAIAQAGGITDRGKASTIKLMRKINGERVVYGIDLSTIDGLKYVDMIVQANDYIYVEPTPELAKEISKDVVPIVSILSSALLIFTAISTLK
jgi:polysaccharide export outer membrane protein